MLQNQTVNRENIIKLLTEYYDKSDRDWKVEELTDLTERVRLLENIFFQDICNCQYIHIYTRSLRIHLQMSPYYSLYR